MPCFCAVQTVPALRAGHRVSPWSSGTRAGTGHLRTGGGLPPASVLRGMRHEKKTIPTRCLSFSFTIFTPVKLRTKPGPRERNPHLSEVMLLERNLRGIHASHGIYIERKTQPQEVSLQAAPRDKVTTPVVLLPPAAAWGAGTAPGQAAGSGARRVGFTRHGMCFHSRLSPAIIRPSPKSSGMPHPL